MKNLRGALPVFWQPRRRALVLAALFSSIELSASFAQPAALSPKPLTAISAQPSPSDLQLSKENRRKAAALAAFAQGAAVENIGDPNASLYWYRKTLDSDPGFADLAIKVAYELNKRNDPTQAIETLKDAIKAAPDEPIPYLYLSQLYAKPLKKFDVALRYAEKGLRLDPNRIEPYIALYEIYLLANREKAAEQTLDRAAKVKTNDPQFWFRLANLYRALLADNDGILAPETAKKIAPLYAKALALSPTDPEILAASGDCAVMSEDFASGITFYQKTLANLHDAQPSIIETVEHKLVRAFLANRQLPQAIQTLENIIRKNPDSPDAYEFLAQIEAENGDAKSALANYQTLLRIDPNQPLHYVEIAKLQLANRQLGDAIATLIAGRHQFPGSPQIAITLGIAYNQTRQFSLALVTLTAARQLAQAIQPELLNAPFYFQYAIAFEKTGHSEAAEALLKKAIDLDPQRSAPAANRLAALYVDRNQNLAAAEKLIYDALRDSPDDPAYLDTLGWLYFKKGDSRRALAQLLKAEKAAADSLTTNVTSLPLADEDRARIFEHLGDVYEKLGQREQAIGYWKKAATLLPNDPALNEKLKSEKP